MTRFESEHDPSLKSPRAADLTVRAVVPVLDEAKGLSRVLAALRAEPFDSVVAVDGGSRDDSVAIAREGGAEVRRETGGLAAQLNCGAQGGGEDVLFFVYADSELPPRVVSQIREALADETVVAGAFSLRLRSDRPLFRWISRGANWRSRLGLGPFGDQGIFVRRPVFEELGGYRADRQLEDLDLVQRLRRRGRFQLLRSTLGSSIRRWERHGLLITTAHHWWALGQHLVGVPRTPGVPTELDRWRAGDR